MTSSDLWMTHPEALLLLMPTERWGLCPPLGQTCWTCQAQLELRLVPQASALGGSPDTLGWGKMGFLQGKYLREGAKGAFLTSA